MFLFSWRSWRLAPCILAVISVSAPLLVRADPISVIDDRGQSINLAAPASRIVALAPNITELVFAAGAGEKLVGVAHYSDFPKAAKNIQLVGDASRADVERITRLRPDLVLAWKSGNHAGDIAKLERLGFKVIVVEPAKLTDIPRLITTFGTLAGSVGHAHQAALEFERGLDELKTRYASKPRVSVFYQIWHEPLMTVNGGHMISDVISLCGGNNVFASAKLLTPVISEENLLAADPQALIASVSLPQGEESVRQTWQRFPRLTAVKNRHFFFVHPDLIQRQTPRILQGARIVCEQLEKVRGKP